MNSFEFAIQMELDGEKYYAQQAEINKDNSLHTVFLILSNDEKNHAKALQDMYLPSELKENSTVLECENVFNTAENFKNEIKKNPIQLDLYKTALEKEKQSIDLYAKLLSEATNDNDKNLFEYLVKQEEDHYKILEQLILLVNRAEEWVESAEFGKREAY